MKRRPFFFLFCFLVSAFWFPASGYAACGSPAGAAGNLIYDGNSHVPEYCNGVSWVVMAPTVNLPPTNGLVGYWKLDDGAGTTAVDSSGTGEVGTLYNSPVWTTGYYNGALDFNGQNGGGAMNVNIAGPLDYPNGADLFYNLGTLTFSAWIYTRSAGSGDFGQIFGEGNGGERCYITGSGATTSFDCTTDSVSIATTGTGAFQPYLNQWTFVAASRNAAGQWTMYVNGVQAGASNQAGAAIAYGNGNQIGGKGGGAYAAEGFDGKIDDVRVYNRILSPAEITTLYNYHISPPSSGLVGYWKFDESSGTAAADSSGNANSGTLAGTVLPVWTTSGKINSALTFNGVDDEVAVPSTSVLKPATALTVTAWVNPASTSDMAVVKSPDGTGFGTGWRLTLSSTTGATAYITTSISGNKSANAAQPPAGQWTHVAFVYDGSFLNAYTNGVSGAPTAATGTVTYGASANFLIGKSNGVNYFNGAIDDVRVYNRALSADEVYGIYRTGSPVCSSPSGYEGDVMYNAGTNHVLQFCDNASWRPLGPVPGAGGSGCTGPVHVEGDMIYSDSGAGSGVMQYCDGAKWIQLGGPNLPVSGLVGYWKFDDGSGASAADSSGNGNTGTLANSPAWTAGKDAGAITLNGSSQYMSVASASSLNLNNFTLSSWINFAASPAGLNIFIAAKDNGSGYSYSFYYASGNFLSCGFDTSSVPGFVNSPAWNPSTNQWYHVVCTYDGANVVIYVNGQPYASAAASGTPLTGSTPLNIGYTDYFGGTGNFNGSMDEVRIYNRALSPQEVWQLYNGT